MNSDTRIDTLESRLDTFEKLVRSVDSDQLELPTPCDDYNVGDILSHVAVWVQVFDGAVNDRELDFDPMSTTIDADWGDIIARAGASIVGGLRDRGIDREMVMTANPSPNRVQVASPNLEPCATALTCEAWRTRFR